MKKTILYLCFLIVLHANAQVKNFQKAEKLYNSDKLKSANKKIDKCLENSVTKNDPKVLLLKSKIMFHIMSERGLAEKHPSAMKEALRYAENSVDEIKDKLQKETFMANNSEYLDELLAKNNKNALENYNLNRYSKALPMFKKTLFFRLDTQALVLAANCYWNLEQIYEAIPMYKQAAEMIYKAVLDSNSAVFGYHREPFRNLCKYYMDLKAYDSAYVVVKNGRELLPNDRILNDYTYSLMRYTLDKIPPSVDYLRMVQNSLSDFPSDSFLNHRENSIFIFLLNGMAKANEQNNFDSLMLLYAKSKQEKAGSRLLSTILQYDIFAGQDCDEFYTNITNYFGKIGLKEACYAAWKGNLNRLSKDTVDLSENKLLNALLTENSVANARYIFERHLELYPKSNTFTKGRNVYLTSRNLKPHAYYDLLHLIEMNDAAAKDFKSVKAFKDYAKSCRMELISESIDSSDFKLCRSIWHQSSTMYADQSKVLNQMWKQMIEQDFRVNYYGTRINPEGKKEMNVPEYKWNGYVDSCISGSMPREVVYRLQDRINYFRRTAGLDEEIFLDKSNNMYCMIAAMMCEANKSMSHEPSDGWRCFIPAGFDALKTSILSKDGNPSIAITAAMGQNHPTVGNRRWLLYPKALNMGIGTAKSYTAIRAVDNSREMDSLKYTKKYVAWPPAKECPKMLLFKKWSFSIDLPLGGATVQMTDQDGFEIDLKQETLADGYGLNTLAWEPSISIANITAETSYTVKVKLKNSQTFTYTVKPIDVSLK
jgi:tetratricopeptide (TPR) repeat protein